MSLEAIKEISDVERQADALVEQARHEARERIQAAQASAGELRAEMIARENARLQQAYQAAQAAGEATVRQSVEQAQAECQALDTQAASNMQAAISLIVGRVVKNSCR